MFCDPTDLEAEPQLWPRIQRAIRDSEYLILLASPAAAKSPWIAKEKGPYYGGSSDFGNNEPHCYLGKIPEGVPFLSHFIRTFGQYMSSVSPKGAEVGWK